MNCPTASISSTDFGCCLNAYIYILEQNFRACGLASPSACSPSSHIILSLPSDLPVHPVKITSAITSNTVAVMVVLSCESDSIGFELIIICTPSLRHHSPPMHG